MPPGSIWSHRLRRSHVHGLPPEIPVQVSSFAACLTSHSRALCPSVSPSLNEEQQPFCEKPTAPGYLHCTSQRIRSLLFTGPRCSPDAVITLI